jgi:cytochrome c oxidase subunit IV
MSGYRETSARGLFYVFASLLGLAGLSLGLRFVRLGDLSMPLALCIASAKALLVVVFFMELFQEKGTARLAFLAGLTLFVLMLTLTVADIWTRRVPPLGAPPGMEQRYRG